MPLQTQSIFVAPFFKKLSSVKFFFLLTWISFAFVLLLAQFTTNQNSPVDSLIEEAINNVGKDLRYSNVYRSKKHLPKNTKYILLWTDRSYAPLSFLEDGQRSFLKYNCSAINCYVSTDIHLLGRDYTKYDAIAFNGRNIKTYRLPRRRSPHQKYIFFNMESSDNYPVCSSKYDGFFNLTATYRLDSDIPLTYIQIKDKNGQIVGPKRNMQWINDMKTADKDYNDIKGNKSKIAAWFVSHCNARNKRQDFVKALNDALNIYGYNIDIYGSCGHLTCPREKVNCNFLLKRDYFFYMALENSFAEDYVTEKLLTALNNDVVPIVYGGANYSRFLPPGSYIDGRKYSIYELASLIHRIVNSPRTYSQFFKWKAYYSYKDLPTEKNICDLCKILNDNNVMQKMTSYENFRSWWNPHYRDRCKWYM